MSDYNIPDPNSSLSEIIQRNSKYQLGEKGLDFYHIKKLKPTFAFDYLSLKSKDFCFNNKYLVKKDFTGLFEGLKKLSDLTYNILSTDPTYRFHKIDFSDPRVSIRTSDFKKALSFNHNEITDDELPNLWQLDFQYRKEARLVGFLYKGVFYILWYDRNHKIYPRK